MCPSCLKLFTDVGLNLHLIKSICGLRKYDIKDIYTWATDANDKRITVLVKDYHKNILDAVENGKFTTRLTFMYPDDSQLVRADALSRIVSELKMLFTNVDITPDHLGTFIDVCWSKSVFSRALLFKEEGDFPNSLKSLPEKNYDPLKSPAEVKTEMQKIMNSSHHASKKTIGQKVKEDVWEKYIGSKRFSESEHEQE